VCRWICKSVFRTEWTSLFIGDVNVFSTLKGLIEGIWSCCHIKGVHRGFLDVYTFFLGSTCPCNQKRLTLFENVNSHTRLDSTLRLSKGRKAKRVKQSTTPRLLLLLLACGTRGTKPHSIARNGPRTYNASLQARLQGSQQPADNCPREEHVFDPGCCVWVWRWSVSDSGAGGV
jgi:hypothetical protein